MLKRAIKSFVLRQGRMTPSQQNAYTKFWPIFGLNIEEGQINYEKIFKRKAPVVLEIGFGMGGSLLEMAKANPDFDFIGIEVHKPGVGALFSALAQSGLQNIRVYCHDAVEVLAQCIPDHSLQKVLILFPDPWPKKRHNKRRLISQEFIAKLLPKLEHKGILHLATDWQDYAEQMLEVVSTFSELQNLADDGKFLQGDRLRPLTKFEQRGTKLGHEIFDIVLRSEK